MGQVCSGAKEEPPKGGLLDAPTQSEIDELLANQQQQQQEPSEEKTETLEAETEDKTAANAALQDLERRKRRELWIVNGAARGMVAVRSTRGSTGYYDQGFAGLLAQHLEQTTSFPDQLPLVLPDNAPLQQTEEEKKSPLYERLAQPSFDGMELVVDDAHSSLRGREASAAVSGDPHKLMDALAESLLDGPYTVLPAKQQLFAGVRPMVENLL